MPCFSIETNRPVDPVVKEAFLPQATTVVAGLLGKPESFVMVVLKDDLHLSFAGNMEPAAFVQLSSIGLPADRCTEYSEKLCALIEQELDIPRNRIYIDFRDLDRTMFGWDGKTF